METSMTHVRTIAADVRSAIETYARRSPWPSFPSSACGDTSLVLGQVLDDHGIRGFEYVCGYKYKADGTTSSHAWLQKGLWIADISADQFPEVLDAVIVSADSAWHTEWHADRATAGTLSAYGAQLPDLWALLSARQPRIDEELNWACNDAAISGRTT
jgi:hypothetical protein